MPFRRRMLRNATTGRNYGYTKPYGTAAARRIQRAYRGRRRRRRLQPRIRTLERKVANNRQWGTYELNAGNTTLVNGKWHIRQLVDPTQWIRKFNATEALEENRNVQLYSCNIQLFHRPTDSLIPLTMKFVTIYLVKLQKETALQTLEDTVQMTTPAGGTTGFNDPTNKGELWDTQDIGASFECFPTINRGCFKVIKKRQFKIQNIVQLTAATSETTEAFPDVPVTTPPFTFKQTNMYMKAYNTIRSGRGDKSWKEMADSDLDHQDRYYLLTHVGGFGSEETLEDGNTLDQGIRVEWKLRSTQ
ncbi:MAG: putative capsid protein [Circoviridae sp.]|nr:MAG: putative capsid protein [Circoviridae sp.]